MLTKTLPVYLDPLTEENIEGIFIPQRVLPNGYFDCVIVQGKFQGSDEPEVGRIVKVNHTNKDLIESLPIKN